MGSNVMEDYIVRLNSVVTQSSEVIVIQIYQDYLVIESGTCDIGQMSEKVTNELLFEHMKRMHEKIDGMDGKIDNMSDKLDAMREHIGAQQMDISVLYRRVDYLSTEIDTIKQRLDELPQTH